MSQSRNRRQDRRGAGSRTGPFSLALATLIVACLAGCSGGQVATSDTAAAKALLQRSLEDWKSGRSAKELAGGDPPVYVSEDWWHSGFQLKDFRIEGDGELSGTNVRLVVALEGVHPKLGNKKASQVYLVTTTPALTISREDR